MSGGYRSLGTLSYLATKDLPICRLTRLGVALLTSFFWHSSGLIFLINQRAYYLWNKRSNHFSTTTGRKSPLFLLPKYMQIPLIYGLKPLLIRFLYGHFLVCLFVLFFFSFVKSKLIVSFSN